MKTKFYHLHNKSLRKHNSKDLKELWGKMKEKGYEGLSIEMKTKFVKSNSSNNKFHAVFSTAVEDRHGEVVQQNWSVKNFKNNPVYLDSHNYGSITHILGKVEKLKSKGQLTGDIIFALDNPAGQLAYNLADGGFLNASSVGFIPLEFSKDFQTIIKSELLEISAVSVPANPQALLEKKVITEKKESKKVEKIEKKVEKVEKVEPLKKTIKKNPGEVIYNLVKGEFDIRIRALDKIYKATKLVCEELKVGEQPSDKKSERTLVNKAIRELLSFKKALK